MATFHAQHPTFHIQHPTFHIPHSTSNIPHSQHPSPPAKYLCLSSAPAAQSVLLTSTPHGFCVDLWHLWEKYSRGAWPHSTLNIPHFTSNIPHSTFHIPHSTFSTSLSACEISVPILRTGGAICVVDKHPAWFLCRSVASAGEIFLCRMAHSPFRRSPCEGHIPHSQHSSPKSTRFFPLRPAPRPNTPFSAHHCNRQTTSPLPSEPFHAKFQTLHSPPRNAIFRPSIPALSKLHPLPFASRSLSYRNSKHAQRRVLRSASSVQTDLFRPIQPATPTISPKNPTQVFHQKSLEC